MDVAQFSYNLQKSEATQRSPFEIVTGRQPLTPEKIASGYKGASPSAYHLAKEWQDNLDLARGHLAKAAKRMKKWADKNRRLVEFQVGDLVMIKLLPQQFKVFRKVHKGLVRRYEGPFPIVRRVGKVSYEVELPPKLKIHNVFHVSYLKAYHGDQEDPSRGESHRAPMAVVTSYDREIEEVLADRIVRRRGSPHYREFLIKWRGRPDSETSWEKEDDLWQFRDQLSEFASQTSQVDQTKYSVDEGVNGFGGGECHVPDFQERDVTVSRFPDRSKLPESRGKSGIYEEDRPDKESIGH